MRLIIDVQSIGIGRFLAIGYVDHGKRLGVEAMSHAIAEHGTPDDLKRIAEYVFRETVAKLEERGAIQ
jgi:hypothetical protein